MGDKPGGPVRVGVAEATSGVVVESFESFFAREYRPVLALAFVLTGDRTAAEDLAQEAFLAAFREWPSISSPGSWVRATVSNRAMSWWRRTYAARRAITRLTGSEPAVWEMPEDTEGFWDEVRRLPRRQAQTISLYYLEDRSADEIGALLGCEPSTVRIHLSRGRRALASRLGVEE
ncbi:MAG TPA: sigma-70 family RNA polymerase sigma factor [Acidimicrobiia bacterium]|nr:sigma-70 family RNA polymerase sigma factor [Acidimicrobiia bacterium]